MPSDTANFRGQVDALTQRVHLSITADGWSEDAHPRDSNGRFGSGDGGDTAPGSPTGLSVPQSFDDSKFTQTFYHGTSSASNADDIVKNGFDEGKLGAGSGNNGWAGEGLYFTERPEYAANYATSPKFGEEGRVLATRVDVRNPWEATTGKIGKNDDFYAFTKTLPSSATADDKSSAIRQEAERRGHDGIVLYGKDGKINELVAFDKAQVVPTSTLTQSEAFDEGFKR